MSETEDSPAFRDMLALPKTVRVPRWLGASVASSIGLGVAVGVVSELEHSRAEQIAHAAVLGSGLAYLTVSILDFYEHFRMEKARTGRWLAWTVVPPGETVNHAMTIGVVGALLVLARPLHAPLACRDYFVLAAPALFLALGWRDELVYHRRRAAHREDIMHTVAHLAAGAMLTSFMVWRLTDWTRLR